METPVNKRFADLINAIVVQGMVASMAALGKSSGLGKETIYRIVNGKNVGVDKLAMFYNSARYISLHWLMTGEGNMFSKTNSDILSEPVKQYSEGFIKREEYERLQWLFNSLQKELENCREEVNRFRDLTTIK